MSNNDQNTSGFQDLLTKNNYKEIENEFLKYANKDNYKGVYQFTEEDGLHINWGKYGYSEHEDEQEPDIQMLHIAIIKFNREFKGRYIAFCDMEDKFNSVYILDLRQLSHNAIFLKEIKEHSSYTIYKTALEIIEKFSSESINKTGTL